MTSRGLGTLLADATFTGSGEPVSGPDAIERMFRDTLIVYDDGTPRTKHITTNTGSDQAAELAGERRRNPFGARRAGRYRREASLLCIDRCPHTQ